MQSLKSALQRYCQPPGAAPAEVELLAAHVEQTPLPSHLWEKGSRHTAPAAQGKPRAPLAAWSLLTQIHNPRAGIFTLLPGTSPLSEQMFAGFCSQ